jgi:hypothetical protein
MSNPEQCYEEISAARDTLERAINAYLRAAGWRYTCDLPGAYWLWEKTLPDGRRVFVGPDTALTIQEWLDEMDAPDTESG